MRNSAQWQVRPGIPAIAAVYAVLQQAAIQRQPLVPLPLLDNKGKLAELVHVSGVYSTDLEVLSIIFRTFVSLGDVLCSPLQGRT